MRKRKGKKQKIAKDEEMHGQGRKRVPCAHEGQKYGYLLKIKEKITDQISAPAYFPQPHEHTRY